MPAKSEYLGKFERIASQTLFTHLNEAQQIFLRRIAESYQFTLQDLRQVSEIALDLEMWGEKNLRDYWLLLSEHQGRKDKKQLIQQLKAHWLRLRAAPNHYARLPPQATETLGTKVSTREKKRLGLGRCPVASPKTRCCNLLTLDVVDNCGYHCSYCSIQSFFSNNEVFFDPGFATKLNSLVIDPNKLYHIGTGQSSDSLMWGNSHGILDALIAFAHRHPNVILEFKTKSANVSHLLSQKLPANLICTWSLNPQKLIDNEERASASLNNRLKAARSISSSGNLVGFHLHPIVHYEGWEREYRSLVKQIQSMFNPQQVAMVSMGTLTFIKPVIRQIRRSKIRSQILKQPLVEADGKLSYPDELKLELFSTVYSCFDKAWRHSVFFYLCMENQRLWEPVLGHGYPSNEAFEEAMKQSYMRKIMRHVEIRPAAIQPS